MKAMLCVCVIRECKVQEGEPELPKSLCIQVVQWGESSSGARLPPVFHFSTDQFCGLRRLSSSLRVFISSSVSGVTNSTLLQKVVEQSQLDDVCKKSYQIAWPTVSTDVRQLLLKKNQSKNSPKSYLRLNRTEGKEKEREDLYERITVDRKLPEDRYHVPLLSVSSPDAAVEPSNETVCNKCLYFGLS